MKKVSLFLALAFLGTFSMCKQGNKKNNNLERITVSLSGPSLAELRNLKIQNRVEVLENFELNDSLPSFLYYQEDNQFAVSFHEIFDTNISSKKEIFSKVTNSIVLEKIVNSNSFIYDSLNIDIPRVTYQKYSIWGIAKTRLSELRDSLNITQDNRK